MIRALVYFANLIAPQGIQALEITSAPEQQ
jgi:hypothetical protein